MRMGKPSRMSNSAPRMDCSPRKADLYQQRSSSGRVSRRCFLIASGGYVGLLASPHRDSAGGKPYPAQVPWFVESASRAGLESFRNRCGSLQKDYLVETLGGGVALFDYNQDGLLDLFLVNGSSFQELDNSRLRRQASRLFRNNGDGTFTDVTSESGLINQGWGMGVAVADYDNDGHPDVFVTNFGKNVLFHNNGDGTFTEVTREAGLEGGNWSTGCAWCDFDGDGRLDLYVARYVDFDRADIPRPGAGGHCHYRGVPVACGPLGLPGLSDLLYHNEGGGKFREVTADAGIRDTNQAYGLGVVCSDFDNDGRPEIFVANDSTANYFWHNKGSGTFEELGFEMGCAVSGDGRAQSSMGIAVGDYDNDGWLDIFVTNFAEDYNTLYHNDRGRFEDISYQAGLGIASYSELGWGAGFIDFNNDGWKDLFVANGHIFPQAGEAGNRYDQPNQLFLNLRNGRFALLEGAESGFHELRSSRGAAWGDLNNNGRAAIVVNNIDRTPFLYAPSRRASGNWIRFRLIGTRSNRDAVGTRLRVFAGALIQTDEIRCGESFLSTCDIRPCFGLGEASTVDRLEIRWPDGAFQSLDALEVNREYTFRQPGE